MTVEELINILNKLDKNIKIYNTMFESLIDVDVNNVSKSFADTWGVETEFITLDFKYEDE